MSQTASSALPSNTPFITHPALRQCIDLSSFNFLLNFLADLRDARDAHIVFEAVRLNILPLITRRLTTMEREQLVSGNVFVWQEAEHKQGWSLHNTHHSMSNLN